MMFWRDLRITKAVQLETDILEMIKCISSISRMILSSFCPSLSSPCTKALHADARPQYHTAPCKCIGAPARNDHPSVGFYIRLQQTLSSQLNLPRSLSLRKSSFAHTDSAPIGQLDLIFCSRERARTVVREGDTGKGARTEVICAVGCIECQLSSSWILRYARKYGVLPPLYVL